VRGVEQLVVLGIIGLGTFVYAVSGFGLALVSSPLLALVIAPSRGVVLLTLASVLNNLRFGLPGLKTADRAMTTRLVLASLAGMPFGLLVLSHASARALRLIIGVVVVVIGVVMATGIRPRRAGVVTDVVAGFVSGVLNTSTGTNGPPLVIGLHARRVEPKAFRSTLAIVFLASNVVALALFAAQHRIHLVDVRLAALAVPIQLVFTAAGSAVHERLERERFEKLTIALLLASALAAIVGALRG
jgi:uncharacterized membrane protein YfcA